MMRWQDFNLDRVNLKTGLPSPVGLPMKVARWRGHGDTRMLHRHYGHLLSYNNDINATANPKEQG